MTRTILDRPFEETTTTMPSPYTFIGIIITDGLLRNNTCSAPESLLDLSRIIRRKSDAQILLKYAGTWSGDDLEECIRTVYEIRGEAEF